MEHYFPNVPGLGNVAISRHAQARMQEDGVSEEAFTEALLAGDTIPDGEDIVTPFRGAMLAKTVYRVQPAARATRR